MAGRQKYRLLCPIARALDRVGDRWTLLILRDLHAGPARFSDLKNGLGGMATNLLSTRLQQLMEDGLIVRQEADFGVMLYQLTELGKHTRDLLFELALFGGRFAPDEALIRPGNLRTVAVTLEAACQRVVTQDMDFQAGLTVDGEHFTLTVKNGEVDVRYSTADDPDVSLSTEYEPMVAAADGEMTMSEFIANHMQVTTHTPDKDADVMSLLGQALALIAKAR